ncbi:hypothetical protein PRK78_003010 [Emydomyces testavorans]|uniref:Rhodopsin domain-containing protein n=1 Tax=Emydomyces testavorans TaxID=2070801 RepID=A0AAF0DG13_9EURO|nr:hypothetical protein PRK78_003010 [Emydomyces testavorans]
MDGCFCIASWLTMRHEAPVDEYYCQMRHTGKDFDYYTFLRWELIGGIDMIIELAIAGASIILVHDIQITNKRKSQVILALSSRILVLIPATLHLYYLHRQLHSADPSYDGSYTTICAQIQLAYVLVANTIPCLKPFIAAYEGSDAKLTFRGHSPSPRHSGVHSQDDEKDNNQNKQEWPSTSNRPLPRQHRRKGSGQSLLPLHASRTSIENHQHRICVEKPKSACFSPVTTAQGALERKAKLSPLMEHAGSLRWSLASDNSPKTTPLEKLSINDGG